MENIYNSIATEFDRTRTSIWQCVSRFLSQLNSGAEILDIGCGNGKYMLFRPDLKFKGIDVSSELVKICVNKGLDVIESNMTSIPFDDNKFDSFITVASYHHLSNDKDRQQALNEMYRILKPGGVGFIVVWAMEQPPGSKFTFIKKEEFVKWKSKDGQVYLRYYHVYGKDDLVNEIYKLEPRFKIICSGYEKGNWFVELLRL